MADLGEGPRGPGLPTLILVKKKKKKKKKKKGESQKEEKPTGQATKNQPHTSAQGPDPPLDDSVFYRQ